MKASHKFCIGVACGIIALAASTLYLLRPFPQGDLDRARAALAAGKRSKALEEVSAWITNATEKDLKDPRLPLALLMRADVLVDIGDAYSALYDYERIANDYRHSPEFAEAIARELSLGVKLAHGEILGGRFGGLKAAGELGEELLVRVTERLPGTSLAETASWELATYYERSNDFRTAIAAYDIFCSSFRRVFTEHQPSSG